MTKIPHDRQNPEIREFILHNVEQHPNDIVSRATKTFGITRQAIGRYMDRLVEQDLLATDGKTKARTYVLKKIVNITFSIKLSDGLAEDAIWRNRILPETKNLPENIADICHYGFTEILNNAIDHSASIDAVIWYTETYNDIEMGISDSGIGIFEKIKRDFKLPDHQSALFELSKGKITSDADRHTGEGIFFTSRMFDKFSISSGDLFYLRRRKIGDEWLIEYGDEIKFKKGTAVIMSISKNADWTWREVFREYEHDQLGFGKTHVPIKLAKYAGDKLISRSQAKRILARVENFSEVMLDFDGIETIGRPFADEIFRVYKNAHPEIEILARRTTPEIEKTINQVKNAADISAALKADKPRKKNGLTKE